MFLKNTATPPPYLSCGATCTTIQYKSGTRAYIESQGYDIVANFGDQYSDLSGDYADATFGVVVLQGRGQVELIDALLRERLDPARWEARRLRVGVPADFQGDERTVVWLSMVVAPGHRLVALTAERFRQGFNVAASRARDQLWLFHAVTAEELAPADLRRRLLEHVTHPPDPVGSAAARARPASTDGRDPAFATRFAQRIHAELSAHGFAVAPGVEVNGRRLDLVVTGDGGRLAVLCDGVERPAPLRRDDVEREQELRRFGWPVVRVRESDHVVDPEAVVAGILAELAAAGIAPPSGTVRSGHPRTGSVRRDGPPRQADVATARAGPLPGRA